jgi:RHS repeat-associated protein
MTTRNVGTTYTYGYDVENRLTTVSGGTTASFAYDADGVRVKSTIGNVTTVFIGSYYEYTTQTSGIPAQDVTPVGLGVACLDGATGTGYLMYSKEDVYTRFAAHPPDGANNARHFICVKYDSGWNYDNNLAYYAFIPEPSDVLVAAVNYDMDTVTSLQGTNTVENGIAKGYASGNLTYTADWYNGAANDGEFTVGGTSFTPNALLAGKKYYYAGATRIAMREGSNAPLWLLGDHLGSTSRVANYDGSAYTNGWQLYKPWGEKRYPSGASGLPTTFRYTGQRQDSYINLYWYGSRWYDPSLNRWTQPDTDVPESQGVQGWDRYAYANNNPVKYNDPTGHDVGCPECYGANIITEDDIEWALNKGLYDTAIAYATDYYDIDISNVNDINFKSVCSTGCYADTDPNANVTIYDKTFNDPETLGDTSVSFFGETLLHESTHADQIADRRDTYRYDYKDPTMYQAWKYDETEAYSVNVDNFDKFPSLTGKEKDFYTQERNQWYNSMSPQDQMRYNNGWWEFNSSPPWENAVNAGNYYP